MDHDSQHMDSIVHHLWTKVHQIKYTCRGQIAVCSAILSQTYSQSSCEVVSSLPQFLGHLIFWWRGPKFLTQFHKFESPLNMCQSSVMIDRVTSETGCWKKKEINTSKTEQPASQHGWLAAIACCCCYDEPIRQLPISGGKDVSKRWGIPPNSESGGIRFSLVIVDSHLLTEAPLKGSCRCPQLTYCQPLSNDRCWRMSTNCQAAVGSPTL